MSLELLSRFLVGGSIIVLISLISESQYKIVSGLVVLFPAVTLVGYYFASANMTTIEIKDMAIFSIVSMPTLVSFFIGVYIAIEHYDVIPSLVIGVIFWIISAGFVLLIDKFYLNLV